MVAEILLAVLIALIFGLILVYGAGRRGPGPGEGLLFFFFILFLLIWAGGAWIQPVGPQAWGVSLVGFFFVGLLFALLLAVMLPPSSRAAAVSETIPEREAAEAVGIAVGLLFWVLVILLIGLIISRYILLV